MCRLPAFKPFSAAGRPVAASLWPVQSLPPLFLWASEGDIKHFDHHPLSMGGVTPPKPQKRFHHVLRFGQKPQKWCTPIASAVFFRIARFRSHGSPFYFPLYLVFLPFYLVFFASFLLFIYIFVHILIFFIFFPSVLSFLPSSVVPWHPAAPLGARSAP